MASAHPGLRRIGPFWHYELRVNGQRLHASLRPGNRTLLHLYAGFTVRCPFQ